MSTGVKLSCGLILSRTMTPNEKNVLKSLVAVAWSDGKVESIEEGIIDGLLWAFGASDEDEKEVKEFAKEKRTMKDDIPLDALEAADKELLLAHAALLTHADGDQSDDEKKLLDELVGLLGFDEADAKKIIDAAADKAKKGK